MTQRFSPTPVERAIELASQARRRSRVPWRRPRAGDHLAVHDFGDEVIGNALADRYRKRAFGRDRS
jgi:hypothetical protein